MTGLKPMPISSVTSRPRGVSAMISSSDERAGLEPEVASATADGALPAPRAALPVLAGRACAPSRCRAGSSRARPRSSTTLRRVGWPSPSKGRVPRPPGRRPSSITVTQLARDASRRARPARKLRLAIDRVAARRSPRAGASRLARDQRIEERPAPRRWRRARAEAAQRALARRGGRPRRGPRARRGGARAVSQ